MPNTAGGDNLRTAYEQVCRSFHAIDDFRAKLLGFLPLVTGGGLVLLTGRLTGRPDAAGKEFFGLVGLFGILVTIGLLAYELNGMKRCRDLIDDGKALEGKGAMDLPRGQFLTRAAYPPSIISKPFAAAWIYPGVLAAWTYLALYEHDRGWVEVISPWVEVISPAVFVLGWVGVVLYDQHLSEKPKPAWLFQLARSLRSRLPHRRPRAGADEQLGTRSAG